MFAVSLGRINGYTDAEGTEIPASQVVFVKDTESDEPPTIRKQYATTAEARVYADVLTGEFPEQYAVAYPPKGTKGSTDDDSAAAEPTGEQSQE